MSKTCEACKGEIPEDAPYFWGRMGGEWHPRCWARAGIVATGMWHNDGDHILDRNYRGPADYLDERRIMREAEYARPEGFRCD